MKKTALRKAVDYLIHKGIIKKDADVSKDLGTNRGQLSTFLNGTAKITGPFRNSFESHYNIKIEDFEEDNSIVEEEQIEYRTTLQEALRDHEERLLRVEAHLEVFENAIAGLLAKDNTDFMKKVGELRSAVQEVVRRRFDELKMKQN